VSRILDIDIEGFEEVAGGGVEADRDDEFLKLLVAELLGKRIEGRVGRVVCSSPHRR